MSRANGSGQIVGIIKGLIDAVLSNRGLAACGSLDVTILIVGDVLSLITDAARSMLQRVRQCRGSAGWASGVGRTRQRAGRARREAY